MSKPKKSTHHKHAVAWIALSLWLVYSIGALWALEKEDIRIGIICSVTAK